MAYIVKVENNKAKLYENASFKRSVGSKVSNAICDDEWTICIEDGKAKQYATKTGSFKRSIGESNAVSAQINGDSIVISYANGKAKEYKASSGSFVRSC
ncbi:MULTISPECIES: hypothetical protein [Helicobacter]|uniref:hypothetical protein n=1 Tax=Helicobacter TaxID=209 RepID=UPI00051D7AE1|nr:hypothetical protein [Helicobacter sp. MIT 03-1616]TLD87090.1 hypothetical protein LS67_007075 [Helicobacter sp. MIT 03-1616]